jgi:hypothetical protein
VDEQEPRTARPKQVAISSDATEPEDGGAPPQDHLSNCFRCLGRREPCILCFSNGISSRTELISLARLIAVKIGLKDSNAIRLRHSAIICWGDSLTTGIGASFGRSYPRILQSIMGGDIRNEGAGVKRRPRLRTDYSPLPENTPGPSPSYGPAVLSSASNATPRWASWRLSYSLPWCTICSWARRSDLRCRPKGFRSDDHVIGAYSMNRVFPLQGKRVSPFHRL